MKIFFGNWKKKKEKNLGETGEKIAANYLKGKGYKIIEFNFKNPYGRQLGEIDIITEKAGEIVFVEVKSRTNSQPDDPLPEESINRQKLWRLQKIADFYLKKNNLENKSFHFDAVSITFDVNSQKQKITHLENIFL